MEEKEEIHPGRSGKRMMGSQHLAKKKKDSKEEGHGTDPSSVERNVGGGGVSFTKEKCARKGGRK